MGGLLGTPKVCDGPGFVGPRPGARETGPRAPLERRVGPQTPSAGGRRFPIAPILLKE